MDDLNRKRLLALVETSDESDEDVTAEARQTLNDAVEHYLDEWDDFARERWTTTNVGDQSPDHVVLPSRVTRDDDVQSLPEFMEFLKVADGVSKDMLEALREVRRAEEKASNAYFMARRRLVEAARRLPDANKRRQPAIFRDDY